MRGIADDKGLRNEVLEHVFKGDVTRRGNRIIVGGYHCIDIHGDERVYAVRGTEVCVNYVQGLFEAEVRDKRTNVRKHRKSTFYNRRWNRQTVVNCIARAKSSTANIVSNYQGAAVYKDPDSQVLVVPVGKTAFPLPRL